jgi:hypothetical protein
MPRQKDNTAKALIQFDIASLAARYLLYHKGISRTVEVFAEA